MSISHECCCSISRIRGYFYDPRGMEISDVIAENEMSDRHKRRWLV